EHVVELVTEALNAQRQSVNGALLLALGVAYKANVGDTRESPALEILTMLRARGADVTYCDPWVPTATVDDVPLKSVAICDGGLADADCVLILADHSAFDYRRVMSAARLIVDARNATWGLEPPAGRVIRL